MNGSYYKNPNYVPVMAQDDYYPEELPMEQSYVENILRKNKGKKVTVYLSYPDSLNWKDKIFTGIIEQAGRDHLIISDPETGNWYLLLMVYLDYIEFPEKVNYGL